MQQWFGSIFLSAFKLKNILIVLMSYVYQKLYKENYFCKVQAKYLLTFYWLASVLDWKDKLVRQKYFSQYFIVETSYFDKGDLDNMEWVSGISIFHLCLIFR